MATRINYFAYGSNMSSARLANRIKDSCMLGVARLTEHQLRFHKVGQDGSAKCDAFYTADPEHFVLGVVFSIPVDQQAQLDHFEGLGRGYERKESEIFLAGSCSRVFLYYATHIDSTLYPYHWYKHHVLRGAEQAGLPQAYYERLAGVRSIDDPDSDRASIEYGVHL